MLQLMRIFTADGSDVAFVAVGQEATGIIAIGQLANGVIAIGQLATGVIAIGQLARGFLAIGMLAGGVFSVGMLSVGAVWATGMIGLAPLAGPGLVLGLFGRLLPMKAFDPRTSWLPRRRAVEFDPATSWMPPWWILPSWRVFVGVAGTLLLAVLWWYAAGTDLILPRLFG